MAEDEEAQERRKLGLFKSVLHLKCPEVLIISRDLVSHSRFSLFKLRQTSSLLYTPTVTVTRFPQKCQPEKKLTTQSQESRSLPLISFNERRTRQLSCKRRRREKSKSSVIRLTSLAFIFKEK